MDDWMGSGWKKRLYSNDIFVWMDERWKMDGITDGWLAWDQDESKDLNWMIVIIESANTAPYKVVNTEVICF